MCSVLKIILGENLLLLLHIYVYVSTALRVLKCIFFTKVATLYMYMHTYHRKRVNVHGKVYGYNIAVLVIKC